MKRLGWSAAVAMCAACSSGGGSGGGGAFGLTERVVVSGLTFPTEFAAPGSLAVVNAFPNLSFDNPVFVTHAGDGTDRLFVVEQRGTIRVFDNDANASTTDVFLNLTNKVVNGGERGLLGLAFHPDYESNGFFYVYYSTSGQSGGQNHRSVVSRFTVSAGDPDAADLGSETELLSFDQPFGNHNGGCLAFGPDGMLYVASGDGGSGGDPFNNGQDLGTVLGKLLRIQPNGGIPADNPFAGDPSARGEIWAYGLRNPWRFSFDRNNGDLWLGDVGQGDREEIDLIVKGGNYGWDLFEGNKEHQNFANVPFADTIGPVQDYPHALGQSVTGGYVYRGAANPSLFGAYLYADFVSGRVWALVYDGEQVYSNTEVAALTNPSSFGEDEAGELYVCSFDGSLYRFEEMTDPPPPFPQRLSDTGLFADVASLEAADGLIEYEVNTPLWSDGATKRRWIALPGVADITFSPGGAWELPVDTVLVKHFEIETAPGVVRRIETRVLVHEARGWQGYTYKWNEAQDDADLLPGADSEVITISGPSGDVDLTWNFPGRPDCFVCHTVAAGRVLGLRTRQLNGDFDYDGVVDNQLRSWNHIGLFTEDIGAPSSYGALPDWEDEEADTTDLARAYMDVNCANCHRPGGPTPVAIDLRYQVDASATDTILIVPQAGDVGLDRPFLVTPGSKEDSVLWERMRLLDGARMPPIGSGVVDEAAVEVVGEWIDSGAD